MEPDTPPQPWQILGFDAMYFIMASVYLGFLLLFGLYYVWSCLFCTAGVRASVISLNGDGVDDNVSLDEIRGPQHKDPSCCDRTEASIESRLERCFRWWGLLCATHPIKILIIGVAVCSILSIGTVFFRVTTDPVELWSSPDSRARIEKDYYDSNFG